MGKALKSFMVGAALFAFGGAAFAQTPATPAFAGTVEGINGAAIVVRGGSTYTLSQGDAVFPGDRVLTRSGAQVSIRTGTCLRSLEQSQSLIVDAEVCTKPAIALGTNEYNQLAGAGGVGGIGSTPALLALLAAGGGAAAAAANQGNSSSP